MTDFLVAALIFAFPPVLHFQFLLGDRLLEWVHTPVPKFDSVFNQRPLLVSILAGSFAGVAFLLREQVEAFYVLMTAAFLLIVLDWVGCSISLIGHLRKRRR